MIRELVDLRPTYGYRRITALLNRQLFAAGVSRINHKRIYRGYRLPILSLAYDQTSGTSRATAVAIQGKLATVGIALRVRGYRRETFLEPSNERGILQGGQYEIGLARWLYGPDPDNSGEFGCAVMPPNGYNLEPYCNSEMETAQRNALEHIDRRTRTAACATIEGLVARDIPIFPLWWPRAVHALSTRFHGFAPNGLISDWSSWQCRLARRAQ